MCPEKVYTVLIVEDEDDLREVLETDVAEMGYQTLSAKNGLEGLEKLRFSPVDVVLSDINMPELSGLQFLKAARSQGFYMPFIVLSAYGTRAEAIELMQLGAFDFLEKPCKFEKLKETLKDATEVSRKLLLVREELMNKLGKFGSASEEEAINALALLKAVRGVK